MLLTPPSLLSPEPGHSRCPAFEWNGGCIKSQQSIPRIVVLPSPPVLSPRPWPLHFSSVAHPLASAFLVLSLAPHFRRGPRKYSSLFLARESEIAALTSVLSSEGSSRSALTCHPGSCWHLLLPPILRASLQSQPASPRPPLSSGPGPSPARSPYLASCCAYSISKSLPSSGPRL